MIALNHSFLQDIARAKTSAALEALTRYVAESGKDLSFLTGMDEWGDV